jgi:hypothetical protein
MPRIAFDDLPDHGRLWIFPATRDLSEAEAETCLGAVDDFLAQWRAHGAPLRSGRELRERRFLLVGVDEDAEAPSGCSIDALVNRLRGLGAELEVGLIDHAPVWFREDGEVRSVPRAEFRELAAEGRVDSGVAVVDTTLTSIRRLREGDLERPAAETWHARAFFKGQATG